MGARLGGEEQEEEEGEEGGRVLVLPLTAGTKGGCLSLYVLFIGGGADLNI